MAPTRWNVGDYQEHRYFLPLYASCKLLPNLVWKPECTGLDSKHEYQAMDSGLSNTVPIDVSLAAGFTRLQLPQKPMYNPEVCAINTYPQNHWGDQEISLNATGTNVNLLVGKSIPLVSAYVGVGYEDLTAQP